RVILYGCETWTLTLGEKNRLRVFENKVPRKIFEPKRDEETGEWRRLHNIETIKSHRLRWAGHVARMEDERGVRRILEGKSTIDYSGDDWKTLAQDRDVWRAYVFQ
ncbi:hypothetical protein C0J52_23312, partial [Blattella germanica]